MREQGLTALFFIAGALAGVIGMHALGFRTSSPASATAPSSQGNLRPSATAPDSTGAKGILEQGLELGQMYQRFAQELDESASGSALPTVPAYNAPVGASLPPAQPTNSEPLQPLNPTHESGVRTAAGARMYTVPSFMRDALRASQE